MTRIDIPGTDLHVSQLCLGLADFGVRISGDEALGFFEEYVNLGGNFVDTAHCYSFWEPGGLGASEEELGRCLRALDCRDDVVVASKAGHPDGGEAYPRPDDFLAPEVIVGDIDDSLERLQVDCMDLYYLHRDDGTTPVDEIMGMLNEEIERGRIRHIAASNWSVERIAEANAYANEAGLESFCASQVEWSLATPVYSMDEDPTNRYATDADAEWYAGSDMPVAAYSSSARGFFAGREEVEDSYGGSENRARRRRARELAEQLDCTPTQVALSWLIHQDPVVIPITGTLRVEHLREAADALDITLTADQVDWLKSG